MHAATLKQDPSSGLIWKVNASFPFASVEALTGSATPLPHRFSFLRLQCEDFGDMFSDFVTTILLRPTLIQELEDHVVTTFTLVVLLLSSALQSPVHDLEARSIRSCPWPWRTAYPSHSSCWWSTASSGDTLGGPPHRRQQSISAIRQDPTWLSSHRRRVTPEPDFTGSATNVGSHTHSTRESYRASLLSLGHESASGHCYDTTCRTIWTSTYIYIYIHAMNLCVYIYIHLSSPPRRNYAATPLFFLTIMQTCCEDSLFFLVWNQVTPKP